MEHKGLEEIIDKTLGHDPTPSNIEEAQRIVTALAYAGVSYKIVEPLQKKITQVYSVKYKREKALDIENNVLKTATFQDALTGIPNRRYLYMYLKAVLAESRKSAVPVSLIALDLDHFKYVNDIYGHEVGDDVLKKMKKILKPKKEDPKSRSLRGYDHVFLDKKLKRFKIDKKLKLEVKAGREGGEEFYIVLPNTTYEEAFIVAERIRNKIKHEFAGFFDKYTPISTREKRKDLPDKLDGLTASMGIAATNKFYIDGKKMKKDAGYNDIALKEAADFGAYLAKKEGRDNIKSVCLDR